MSALTVYARHEPTTDSATRDAVACGAVSKAAARRLLDVQIYRDRARRRKFARFPWHYSNKPTHRNRYITLNCYRWKLHWL